MSNVKITLDVDLNLKRRLAGLEVKVLKDGGKRMRNAAKDIWSGWAYGRQYTPQRRYYGKPGTSKSGWTFYVQSTEDPRYLVVENNSVDHRTGKSYSSYVHRAGDLTKTPEWTKVYHELATVHVPVLVSELKDAILQSLQTPNNPQRVRENQSSEAVFRQITE